MSEQDVNGEPAIVFDWSEEESVSTVVVRAVAAVTGEDPLALEPLGSAIDPDALEALVGTTGSPETPGKLSVEFPYAGAIVQVRSTGEGRIFVR